LVKRSVINYYFKNQTTNAVEDTRDLNKLNTVVFNANMSYNTTLAMLIVIILKCPY